MRPAWARNRRCKSSGDPDGGNPHLRQGLLSDEGSDGSRMMQCQTERKRSTDEAYVPGRAGRERRNPISVGGMLVEVTGLVRSSVFLPGETSQSPMQGAWVIVANVRTRR